jgi:glycosyltransferase involved in cell wall biosynthesis
MESMAAGIPCIATNTGSIAELIDSKCGVLVDQRNPSALKSAIILLGCDGAYRRKLGNNAKYKVAKYFDASQSARALKHLIEHPDWNKPEMHIPELVAKA